MKLLKAIFGVALIMAIAGCACQSASGNKTAGATMKSSDVKTMAAANTQTPHHFQYRQERVVDLNYLLYLPKGFGEAARKNDRWPLILFLHGAGERGTNIWKVEVHGPPKNVTNHMDLPFIIVSPQCAEHELWSKESLLGLLDKIVQEYPVDTNRVYLTGLSMGGYGTWDLGLSHPDRFAAIAPICGGGQIITVLLSGRDHEQALKTLGVWAFHGAKDPVVPVAESQRMIDALKKAGATDVKLTVYPEAGHDSWSETYKNPEFYEWLLQHRRGTTNK
jgi:predicted peptidase